ncbi:MAG: signal recognition particle subunit SRP19 [Halobacteriales archaeon]
MPDTILWPAYFDADKSRGEGRRVPLELAVRGPTVDEIAGAVQQVGYDARIERDVAYPRQPWAPTGRVVVKGADEDAKNDVVQAVGAYIGVLREE